MSDLCPYVNNAYTDAAPYFAVMYIQHPDPVVVAAFQAFYPNGRQGLSPVMAAGIYGAGGPTGPFTALPWVFVDTAPPGLDINAPNGTQANSTVIDVCGNRVSYNWILYLVLAGPATALDPSPEAIMQRRFIRGFELPEGGEGGSTGSTLGNQITRDASRTPEGYGLSWRNRSLITAMTLTEFTGGGVSTFRDSWERIYARLRNIPTSAPVFWRCRNSSNSVSGAALVVTPGGAIEIYNVNAAGTFTLVATATAGFTLNQYVKLDIVVEFSSGAGGRIRLWHTGVLVADASIAPASQGLGLTGFHSVSEVGNTFSGANLEMDFDDWENMEKPTLFTGLDWISGSHVIASRPIAYDASHSVNWVGDYRILIQNPAFRATQEVVSSTSGARMAVLTDATILRELGWEQSGVAAFLVSLYGRHAGGADGQLGYTIGGGGDVLTTVNEGTTNTWTPMIYRPTGMTAPADITPLVLLHTKGADAGSNRELMLMAAVEYLGAWGSEDLPVDITPISPAGIHNAPYITPTGQYGGNAGAPPFGQVTIQSGTYVGNGTGQDISLDAPAHWFHLRPLTGSAGGAHWWSSMVGTHRRVDLRGLETNLMPQALVDSSGQALLRLAGADAQNNAAGVTYQYITVSDPGMRFLLNGAFMHDATLAAAVNPLIDSTFFPEAAFLMQESLGVAFSASGLWYKGVGHASARASLVDAAENANALSFGLGALSSQTPLHTQDVSAAYALWRLFDGPGTPGGPATGGCDPSNPDPGRAVAITSYVGNGAGGTRIIPVALDGRRPLFAMVTPHNGGSFVRDPSHAGSDSSAATLDSISTVAIVGGDVNQISVSTALNATGIIYDVFVLPGDVGGSGWGTNGTFYPVPPAAPCSPVWPPNPSPPEPPPGPGAACPSGDFPTELT